MRKILATGALMTALAGCGSSSAGTTGPGSGAPHPPAPGSSYNSAAASLGAPCHMSLAGAVTEYLTVFLASDQDCSSMAFQAQQVFQGATVTSDGTTRDWPSGYSATCMGTLTYENDLASVQGPGGTDPGGVCNTLGFGAVP